MKRLPQLILLATVAAVVSGSSCNEEPIQSIHPLATAADTVLPARWNHERRTWEFRTGNSVYWSRIEFDPDYRTLSIVPNSETRVRYAARLVRLGIVWYLEVGPIRPWLPDSTSWLVGAPMPDSIFLFYRFEERGDSLLQVRPLADWSVNHFAESHPGLLRVIPLVVNKKDGDRHWVLSSETAELRHFLGHFGPADSLFRSSTEYRATPTRLSELSR
jgi:hypothetical protein